jgi:CRISPR/Cas system-associated protein Cas7 (RAMP superfamily)
MAVVKAVSFPADVLEYGLETSKELFGGNFSIFITYLICSYRKSKIEINFKEDEELGEELKECISNMLEVFKEVEF